MLELEEAVARILATVPPPTSENVPLADAHHRVLLEQVVSPIDLPLFDNSAMDGYAVRASDVATASADTPVRLRVIGKVAAGSSSGSELPSGAAIRLFTGSPLPVGADAVVMQEDTRLDAGKPDEVSILDGCKPWENVRLRGEDLRNGTMLIDAGECLTGGQLALLAAAGITRVNVARQPVVGLVATGSELREPGANLAAGQIYESNRIALAAFTKTVGAIPRIFPLVTDDLESTRRALETAFEKCDLVITSGGVSVGEMDFVKRALTEAGGELQFWKVAIRPGRPFVFGRWKEKLLFGLPGNPVSAMVTFLLLVRPALLKWQGATHTVLPAYSGILGESLSNPGARRHFMRVKVSTEGKVYSAGVQASHLLSSLATANGLVDLPPNANLPPGTSMRVLRWE